MTDNFNSKSAPVVALDIGNVCFRLQPDECSAMLGFDSEEHAYAARPQLLTLIHSYETGCIDCDTFYQQLREQAAAELNEATAKAAWDLLIGNEINGMHTIIDRFRALGLSVVFFSNISVKHFEIVKHNLSFIDKIDGAILSFEVGHVKPAREIYEAMERTYCDNRPPALYLDDRIENIRMAESRGWNSCHVSHVDDIRVRIQDMTAAPGADG